MNQEFQQRQMNIDAELQQFSSQLAAQGKRHNNTSLT